jgi:hypothetical protein
MRRFPILALALVLTLSCAASAQEKDAKTLAQEILDQGALKFDTRDAAAMAATYTEDAEISLFTRDDSTGETKVDVKKGRAEIESFYKDIFKDATEKTTSKNTVAFARFVGAHLMLIQGEFQPDLAKEAKYPFVQVRVREQDKWQMKSLQLFVISQN